tara:strand:- start:19099 stop:22245 length:3147 start_codon:yes stop_codon:yes gene_type:complete
MAKQQYPTYTQPRNPFGSLTHSAYVPTYVGLPIDRMKETADVLQDKYNTAISNMNTAETMLAQMKLNSSDESKRTNALAGFQKELESYKISGNYEDANTAVSMAAKNIATNSGLLKALESAKDREAQIALNKTGILTGKYEEEDVIYAQGEADRLDSERGGVTYNEKTGAWENKWKQMNIPEVQNIGAAANDFLANYKADTFLGLGGGQGYVKKVDPTTGVETWHKAERDFIAGEAGLNFVLKEEAVDIEEVAIAAHKQMLQDPKINRRLAFEYKRDGLNPTIYAESRGESFQDAKTKMQIDLVNILGYDENKVFAMSDDELTELHFKNVRIQDDIQGATMKASYTKEMLTDLRDSYATWLKKNQVKNDGGDEQVFLSNQIALGTLTGGMKLSDRPNSVTNYDNIVKGLVTNVAVHEQTIKNINKNILAEEAKGGDVSGYKTELSNTTMLRDKALDDVAMYEKIYAEAVAASEKELGRKIDTEGGFRKLDKDTDPIILDDIKSYKNKLESLYRSVIGKDDFENVWEKVSRGFSTGLGIPNSSFANVAYNLGLKPPGTYMGAIFGENYTAQQKKQLELYNELTEYETRFQDDALKGSRHNSKYKSKYKEYFKEAENIASTGTSDMKTISKNLNEIWEQKSIAVPVLDMSTIDKAGDATSNYSSRATALVKSNLMGLGVYDAMTGEKQDWATGKNGKISGGLNINADNLTVIGPTMDYIFGVGYGYKAIETTWNDPKDKSKGAERREVILFEQDGTTVLSNLTLDYLKQGQLQKDVGGGVFKIEGTGNKGYDQLNDYAAKRIHTHVEQRLSWFQNFPPTPDVKNGTIKKLDLPISLTADRKATVTRNVQPNGSTTYDIKVYEYDQESGNKGKPVWNSSYQKGYKDLYDVESILEKFAGVSNNYSVPLGSLKHVTDNELPFATIKTKNGTEIGSAAYLDSKFKNEFQRLLKTNGKQMTNGAGEMLITSLTRSIGYNASIGGARDSGHLKGMGADINSTNTVGTEVLKWLEANSEDIQGSKNYKKIKGYNLKWWNHNVKTGMHIDLKFMENL